MAEETKIGVKLEEEAKPIKKMCEKLMDAVNYELDKGIENVDAKELGEVVDMIKDLYEAKKEMYEACYYKSVVEAMEKKGFEDEEEIEDEGRKGYRGRRRDSRGRFMSNRGRRGYESPMMWDAEWDEMERMRDMDRPMGKMYYSGSGSSMSGSMGSSSGGNRSYSDGMSNGQYSSRMQRDGREGRSGEARRSYMESKEMGNDKQMKMKELENYMKELSTDVSEMIADASPEEKSMLKSKMSVLMQKIQ